MLGSVSQVVDISNICSQTGLKLTLLFQLDQTFEKGVAAENSIQQLTVSRFCNVPTSLPICVRFFITCYRWDKRQERTVFDHRVI